MKWIDGLKSTPMESSSRFFHTNLLRLSVEAHSCLQMQCISKDLGAKNSMHIGDIIKLLDGTSVKVPYMTNSKDQYLED